MLTRMDWRDRFKCKWEALNRQGWSQERLAEMVNVSQGAVAHWLAGRRAPKDLKTYEALAEAIGMHPAELLYGLHPDHCVGEEAADFAREWEKLPPDQRLAIKAAVHALASQHPPSSVQGPTEPPIKNAEHKDPRATIRVASSISGD